MIFEGSDGHHGAGGDFDASQEIEWVRIRQAPHQLPE